MIRCKWCRRKIGRIRQLVDREYCSNTHRKLATTASARDLRDARYIYGEDEYWIVDTSERRELPKGRPSSFGDIAMLGGLLILGLIWMPHSGQDGAPSWDRGGYAFNADSMWSKFRRSLPSASRPLVELSADFRSGLGDWAPMSGEKAGSGQAPGSVGLWAVQAGVARPKELRLWTPSMKLKDYNLDFRTQIEHKAVGWAFRAKDYQNYYATKIVLSRPAPFPVSEIVRFAVLNGREQGRVQLPLPMQLQRGTTYDVRVKIKGDHFVTSVNGATVDSWQDPSLKSGGVGFFTDRGEIASIMAVKVTEERGLFEGLFLPALLAPLSMW